jgi:acyl carrier protein
MITTTELSSLIAEEILNQADREIANNEKMISSGLIDSFKLVDLSILIEDTYGVLLDDSELNVETFDTLAELVELINSRL